MICIKQFEPWLPNPSSASMLYPLGVVILHEKNNRGLHKHKLTNYAISSLITELYQLKEPFLSVAADYKRTLLLLYLANANRNPYLLLQNYSQFLATPTCIIHYIILE